MRARVAFLAALAAVALLASACKKTPPKEHADVADAAPVAPAKDGRAIAKDACMSCHSEEMLAQQRLPKEKWAATVKKMSGWGANLDPGDEGALVAWLATTYGPDAGPWEPAPIGAAAATAEIAPEEDAAYANGDPEHGKALFTERCAPCHGDDARGKIGTNLVERPVLYRARAFAETVRRGRGKMTPIAATDREIADVVAHLRRLRIP